jgi:hypothetical protein
MSKDHCYILLVLFSASEMYTSTVLLLSTCKLTRAQNIFFAHKQYRYHVQICLPQNAVSASARLAVPGLDYLSGAEELLPTALVLRAPAEMQFSEAATNQG